MLKNKNLNIVFAIIIAVSLWAYVLGDVNPTTSVTVKDVPITFVNEEALESSNMVVLDCSDTTINITVSGARTEATKVKQSDFKVTADVEALDLGSNVVRLSVKGPDKVEITNISTNKITVNVDQLISVRKEVKVTTVGELEDDIEPYIIDIAKDNIKVSGAKSLVSRVHHINAVIDASNIGNTMKTLSAELQPVDEVGDLVEGVNLESYSTNVTAVMHHKKTVNLEVPVVGTDASDYERSVILPKTIVIKGEDDILSEITSIKCEEIDLNVYEEDTRATIVPILPEGVQVSTDSSNLYAEVIVKEYSKEVLKVPKDAVKLLNMANDFTYEMDIADFTITVQGKESDLKDLDISIFEITADVKDLEKGTHTVKVKVECSKNFVSIKPSTEEIKIVISKK